MAGQFAILDLGTPDLIIILAIILLLFGSKNLPKLTKSLADSVRELRKGFSDDVHGSKSETKQKTPDSKNREG